MPTQILMPALSPTMEDGTLARWLVREGDTVHSGDVIAEIETDKATMEYEAADDGILGKILVPEGSAGVAVNTPIAVLLADGETLDETAPLPPSADAAAPAPADGGNEQRVFASPLARRLAAQQGLDLSQITGTGPRGRIVKRDVETALPQPVTAFPETPAAAPAAAQPTPPPAPQPVAQPGASDVAALYADRDFTEVPLDGMRRTIAARLTEAKQTIPHFYLRRDVRLDALLALRKDLNAQLAPRGVKLSVNDFIIKACANALQLVPAANAVWAGDRILQLAPSDVAVAVAVEGGLFTPVLRDAHLKSLSTLSAEMKDLAARSRDRKLSPADYQGGSFAISNLGMFGIENFDAVINPPHGAILAVGAGIKKPVVAEDGTLTTATVMSTTLSVDHRTIDGAMGATLLGAIVEGLETPLALLV